MYVHFQLLEAIGGNIVLRTRTEFRISCLTGGAASGKGQMLHNRPI